MNGAGVGEGHGCDLGHGIAHRRRVFYACGRESLALVKPEDDYTPARTRESRQRGSEAFRQSTCRPLDLYVLELNPGGSCGRHRLPGVYGLRATPP
jgi:hypothetical protein